LSAACFIVGLASVSAVVVPSTVASAATDTVTTCANSGPGSLPAVVAAAVAGDTIGFATGLSCPPASPITLTSTLTINKSVAIAGPGAMAMAVSGGGITRVFDLAAGNLIDISGLTIENGEGFSNVGAGIYNEGAIVFLINSTVSGNIETAGAGSAIYNSGTMNLIDSTVSGNTAPDGQAAGIFNSTTMNLINSTVSGNSATDGGAGIANANGTLTLTNSTVVANTAGVDNSFGLGGAIFNSAGTVNLTNSTVADNKAPNGGGIYSEFGPVNMGATIVANNTGGDCLYHDEGTATDSGYNLDSDGTCGFSSASPFFDLPSANPLLGPPQNNGGLSVTVGLLAGSPAIDYVTKASGLCPSSDQRGAIRTTPCDIGAYDTDGNPIPKKFKPAKGKVGKKVTITGSTLSGATKVSFNGTPAVITTDTATKITTKVPVGATTGPISVTTLTGGTATTPKSFKVT
jgi:hypothetical protein